MAVIKKLASAGEIPDHEYSSREVDIPDLAGVVTDIVHDINEPGKYMIKMRTENGWFVEVTERGNAEEVKVGMRFEYKNSNLSIYDFGY